MTSPKSHGSESELYARQNRKIHQARAQLSMDLDDCRELARQINGKCSLSSLSLRQRWELIEILKAKGARVLNPRLADIEKISEYREITEEPKDVYPNCLEYWNSRFPKRRKGFASNKELAWIESLWELDFDDGRAGAGINGLRGFIFRQTKGLKDGPVGDLAFLRSCHVQAVLTPLKANAKSRNGEKNIQKEGGNHGKGR